MMFGVCFSSFMILAFVSGIIRSVREEEVRIKLRFGSPYTIGKDEDPFRYWLTILWYVANVIFFTYAIHELVTY